MALRKLYASDAVIATGARSSVGSAVPFDFAASKSQFSVRSAPVSAISATVKRCPPTPSIRNLLIASIDSQSASRVRLASSNVRSRAVR
ncbi:hypothetical protein [Candidatus Aquicultor sp.]